MGQEKPGKLQAAVSVTHRTAAPAPEAELLIMLINCFSRFLLTFAFLLLFLTGFSGSRKICIDLQLRSVGQWPLAISLFNSGKA